MQLSHIKLVQATFTLVTQDTALFATQLYDSLFRQDPCLCYLFPKGMETHGAKFMATLAEIVAGLERPFPLIQQTLKPLGHHHATYKIQPAHYHTFATALCHALADTLGEAFTEEVETAWLEAYYLIIGVMRETAVKPISSPKLK